jgi:hypothetical protein
MKLHTQELQTQTTVELDLNNIVLIDKDIDAGLDKIADDAVLYLAEKEEELTDEELCRYAEKYSELQIDGLQKHLNMTLDKRLVKKMLDCLSCLIIMRYMNYITTWENKNEMD